MSVKEIVQNLEEEIKGENRKDIISGYEETLSKNVEELSKYEIFFNLPLNYVFSVISKVDFDSIDEDDKIIEIIQNIVKNIINKHFEEKETIFILQSLNIKTIPFSIEEIFSLLELIKNCPILVNFCHLYKEQNKEVDIDYEYELQQKDQEIEKLKLGKEKPKIQIPEFPPILEKPKDYEPNIVKACKEGKLTSVQYLIEIENEPIYVKERDREHYSMFETPIHNATTYGHLPIVQYIIERHKAEIEYEDCHRMTPLLIACEKGYFPIAEYLISKGANIEVKEYYDEQTPLHYACKVGNLPIVECLISNGADIETKDKYLRTALHFASKSGSTDVVKYLVSMGANKNSKTWNGKTPYALACADYNGEDKSQRRYEIRNILR